MIFIRAWLVAGLSSLGAAPVMPGICYVVMLQLMVLDTLCPWPPHHTQTHTLFHLEILYHITTCTWSHISMSMPWCFFVVCSNLTGHKCMLQNLNFEDFLLVLTFGGEVGRFDFIKHFLCSEIDFIEKLMFLVCALLFLWQMSFFSNIVFLWHCLYV